MKSCHSDIVKNISLIKNNSLSFQKQMFEMNHGNLKETQYSVDPKSIVHILSECNNKNFFPTVRSNVLNSRGNTIPIYLSLFFNFFRTLTGAYYDLHNSGPIPDGNTRASSINHYIIYFLIDKSKFGTVSDFEKTLWIFIEFSE